jgi:hypothetical protein
MTKKQKIQPKKVQRFVCPKCGELQIKIYPWSSFVIQGSSTPLCNKCLSKKI